MFNGQYEHRDGMLIAEPARREEPFFQQAATTSGFEDALRNAVRANAKSMDDLQRAIRLCVTGLRTEGMECEAALLTMKACVRHFARKHSDHASPDVLYSGLIMEQIVRWSIVEFYRNE
jgi:hypothetical protein